MSEFFKVVAPDQAFQVLKKHMPATVGAEMVDTAGALGRVTAEEITSPEDLPAFARSTMDGYSVRAQDTFGASEAMPAYLEVVGEVPMGKAAKVSLATGQAAVAYTGGMLAGSADAVVMVERTQKVDERTIEVLRPVAPGENVVQSGEDVRRGDPVLPKGRVIRPQDIGGALALGLTTLKVSRKPRVAIVSTGDELVAPHQRPGPGQIRDINTYTISGLVSSCGGLPIHVGRVEDDFEAQKSVAAEALDMGDIVVFSAGSSVSSRDLTASVFDSLGDPGVLAHGIAIKPGKPTVMGMVDGKPLIGLPGNPVSAMVVFDITVRPAIYHLSGCVRTPTLPTTTATLTRDIPSQAGREDYVQVRLSEQDGTLEAEPIFGKSNLIYTLVRADGVLRVPLEKGGIYAGEEVSVRVY